MATTRQNLRDDLRLELKIDPNGRIWSDSILNKNIEKARTKIQADGGHNWSFNDGEYSVSSVAGTATYALPSDFVRLEEGQVRYNNTSVFPVDYARLKAQYPDLTSQGQPSFYYLRGANIGFFQVPNEVKTIDFCYRKKLTLFTADSDDSGMADEFNEAIIQYACYLCWSDIQGREDKATQAIQNYTEAMDALYSQYLNRNDANLTFKFEIS